MLKILFDRYKWYVAAVLFLVYSVGVWNVSGEVKESSYNLERLHAAEEIIRVQQENEKITAEITINLNNKLAEQAAAATKHQKEVLYAIKDSRYTTCVNTDRVRDLYKRKLQAQ